MTNPEEIKEGVEGILGVLYNFHLDGDTYANQILTYLNDNDVVIKVDRELPDNEAWHKVEREFEAYCAGRNDMLKAGYEAVEPLKKDA